MEYISYYKASDGQMFQIGADCSAHEFALAVARDKLGIRLDFFDSDGKRIAIDDFERFDDIACVRAHDSEALEAFRDAWYDSDGDDYLISYLPEVFGYGGEDSTGIWVLSDDEEWKNLGNAIEQMTAELEYWSERD